MTDDVLTKRATTKGVVAVPPASEGSSPSKDLLVVGAQPYMLLRMGRVSLATVSLLLATLSLLFSCGNGTSVTSPAGPDPKAPPLTVDHGYAPARWVTAICLPDDADKHLVHMDGTLMYDYLLGLTVDRVFRFQIQASVDGDLEWVGSSIYSGRVPIVQTRFRRTDGVELLTEVFRVAPGSGSHEGPFNDMILMFIRNTASSARRAVPTLSILGNLAGRRVIAPGARSASLSFDTIELGPGEEQVLAIGVAGPGAGDLPSSVQEALALRSGTIDFWENWERYGNIQVPDTSMQELLDASIRNIFQARDIVDGLPAFQVGCCVYNSLWVVDAAFILETAAYIGSALEARNGIEYLMSRQRPDGSIYILPNYHKEMGIAAWILYRHARLTGDKAWLEGMWSKLEKLVDYIRHLRVKGGGLMPPGYTDGGLGIPLCPAPEYSNDYWNLTGMKAAAEAAAWMGKEDIATEWLRAYEDYLGAFETHRTRYLRTDEHGNEYLPVNRIRNDPPNKAQWAFCHSVFPGRLYDPGCPFADGMMSMLRATEAEGIPYGSGWDSRGVWTYLASFYGHAWLWMGQREEAIRTLYNFANHASPTETWIEEQHPQEAGGEPTTGDMPHNWASAELIRFVRHLLVLERGDALHLLEGLPAQWVEPGDVTRLRHMPTSFGEISLDLEVSEGGSGALMRLLTPDREPPAEVILHTTAWSGSPKTVVLPVRSGAGIRTFHVADDGSVTEKGSE